MKKRVTLILEVESDDNFYIRDSFIKDDLTAEIACTTNHYELISISSEEIQNG